MNRRLRSALTLSALLVPALAVGATAQAEVSPEDAAATQIAVPQVDRQGDVHVDRTMRSKVSRRVRASVDVVRVDYAIDRVAQTISITYAVDRGPVAVPGARQYFATVADSNATDASAPFAVLLSRPGSPAVRVITGSNPAGAPCDGATATVTEGGRVATQVVPFTCLPGVEHARLTSGVGLDKRRSDVAYDIAKPTRDLPLTPYVAPVG